MNLNVGSKIGGFIVERIRESKELGGRLVEMRHESCGAQLLWMDNGESNKLFSVAFKTIPEDHTGVFHILEHSVLCGSKKYPVKEPFVDLMKSSLNTFLNAMTFQDKTMYPISSRNERDYLNLTSVYLDAVFAPLSVHDENAFRQEGWHLEKEEGHNAYFNGVVYNEMKGAMSGLDDILDSGMNALLFPDTCYGYNSGGDPEHIPELTYGIYCKMYNKYYNPSNARFYLDGDVPLEKTIELIEEYIGNAKNMGASNEIPLQDEVVAENTLFYEIASNDDETNKTVISFGRIIASFEEKRRIIMSEILCSYLAGTNDSPITRAILDAGLGENVELSTTYETQQAKLVLTIKNTEKSKLHAIKETISKIVSSLLEDGLDKAMLTAHLNRFAFDIKNMWEPAGLVRCIMSSMSSLYGGDPMLYMENDDDIEAIRTSIENGEFNVLLRELFDLSRMCTLLIIPSKTRGEELAKTANRWANEMYEALDESSIEELKRKNTRLHEWQRMPDSEEHVKMLPVLPLYEVGREPMLIPTEVDVENGIKVMRHAIKSNGIKHYNLYFLVSDIEYDELPKIGLLTRLLSKLPTKKHSLQELTTLINTYIGSLRFGVTTAQDDAEYCRPYITASFSALDASVFKAAEIVSEILLDTDFSDAQRIRENVIQLDEATKQRAIMGGNNLGISAVNAHYLASAACSDQVNGVGMRMFIKSLASDFENVSDGLATTLADWSRRAFCRERLTIGVTSMCAMDTAVISGLFPKGEVAPERVHYATKLPKKMGIRIPAQVSFAEKGMLVEHMNGELNVAANVISLSWLWNKVRVQGGAYGSGLRANENGMICHYSYRDPSPARTLSIYDQEFDFIKEFCNGDEQIEKFIISSIGETEPLLTPSEQGSLAERDLMNGYTYDKKRARRAEMLETTKEKLMSLRDTFEMCANNAAVCVVGSDNALAEVGNLTIIDL